MQKNRIMLSFLSETARVSKGTSTAILATLTFTREKVKIRCKSLILLLLTGCVTGPGGRKDPPVYLDLQCTPFSLAGDELDLTRLEVLEGTRPALFGVGRKRNTRPLAFYLPFTDEDELGQENRRAVEWSPGTRFLAGSPLAQRHLALLEVVMGNARRLEIRDMPGNITRSTGATFAGSLEDPVVRHVAGSWWVAYKDGASAMAMADSPWQMLQVSGEPTLVSRPVKGVSIPERPVLLPRASGVRVVWPDPAGRTFTSRIIGPGGAAAPVTLPVKPVGGMESFQAFGRGEALYLAWVEGDSLLGEARLRLALIRGNRLAWDKTYALEDIQAGPPVIAGRSGLAWVMLPVFRAGKGWLNLYRLDAREGVYRGRRGPLAEGTNPTTGFFGAENTGVFLILQNPQRSLKRHSLCQARVPG